MLSSVQFTPDSSRMYPLVQVQLNPPGIFEHSIGNVQLCPFSHSFISAFKEYYLYCLTLLYNQLLNKVHLKVQPQTKQDVNSSD